MFVRRLGGLCAVAAGVWVGAALAQPPADRRVSLAPSTLKAVARVDPRFQSYNIEMSEVIGGRFWAPYPKPGDAPSKASAGKSGGVDVAAMFRKREPLDFRGNRRLRTLAAALGPAYVRVSGAWANTVHFQDDDAPSPAKPPSGFEGVLTRAQWAGLVDFAKASDAKIVTSFGVNAGARGPDGVWSPQEARKLLRYTRSIGGHVYAAELINEPNVGPMVGLPKGYEASTFAKDEAVFRAFLHADAPEIKTVGPGSTGEGGFALFPKTAGQISSEALLEAEPRARFDIFSYHFYGAVSQRCAGSGKDVDIKPDAALSEAWLARTDQVYEHYKALHDRFAPGTPVWVTETAQAGCGGDAWATTFLDSFRYVDQLGRLARKNVAAVFHNTLAASDYALIDDTTWAPRPDYWAALMWRRLMGERVLDTGPLQSGLHVYAQCLRGRPGGVALVALNLDRTAPATLALPAGTAERYTLSADDLQSGTVKLNGRPLTLTPQDGLPSLQGERVAAGRLTLAPATLTFLALPRAANPACRSAS